MKLSIIIPIYNAEKYLMHCIDSIRKIKDNIEVILVNDGSKDSSRSICEDVCANDGRFRLYNNSNHGVSYSRNYGIKNATGDYLMFVDADDVLKDGWEKVVFNNMDGSDVIYIIKSLKNLNDKFELLNYILGINNPCIAGPVSKLFRNDFIKENKIVFNEKIINGEDMLFNVDIVNAINSYSIINKSIYWYRQNVLSSTKTFNEKIFDSDIEFHKELSLKLKASRIDSKQKNRLINFCTVNSIFILTNKLSFTGNYMTFKEGVSKLKKVDIYKNALMKSVKDVSIKAKIVIVLIKNKSYLIAYYILKFWKKTRKYNKNDNSFVEI
ncbi:MAG TPA: hypothetical protein DDY53_04505 [Clostridiales bacterium]|jgi:glycosyltransferase involved in cell wall biosynthesis|nr:hypothetical protein [Clostridiales bacterium]